MTVPKSLEEAIEQAKSATKQALESGCGRWQVELVVPEIALQAQVLALEFASLFEQYGAGLKVLFPDAGSAALARRDWGETSFRVGDLGSRFTPVESKVGTEDEAFLLVSPSAVEVKAVESLCEIAGNRPVILLIPQLEDVSIVGIGYAARQLRERFLSTLESCYYFRPLEGAVVLRSYPSLWQVWREGEDGYELITETSQKPMGEALDLLVAGTSDDPTSNEIRIPPKKAGIFASMQQFLRALNR